MTQIAQKLFLKCYVIRQKDPQSNTVALPIPSQINKTSINPFPPVLVPGLSACKSVKKHLSKNNFPTAQEPCYYSTSLYVSLVQNVDFFSAISAANLYLVLSVFLWLPPHIRGFTIGGLVVFFGLNNSTHSL